MRPSARGIALSILAASSLCFAGNLKIVPTTTFAAETSNNTSAADSFRAQSNGNISASNISKVDLHSLLYPGAWTKIYAHMMLWFGGPSPMNVGYHSNDPAQVHRQIDDMISRGVDGVIMDWYGPGNFEDDVAKLVMAEAETHPGFTFAIMVDKGAIQWNSCTGCSPQEALIQQIRYVEQTYFPSPAYMRINGKPVITNFDLDLHFSLDWNAVNAAVGGTPVYIFQHAEGFTHTLSGGSYSWVMPVTTDYGMGYMTKFYTAGLAAPQEERIGAAYKGFDDTLASWTLNRIMKQQCGQTWLSTFDEIKKFYDSGHQLDALQLVTWNDYQEATEIETGIDNCVSLLAGLSKSFLQWSISGNENTIDHYVVYVSSDGQNLMPLNTLMPGARTLELTSYSLPAGSYVLYVQAVGKPTLKNTMSGGVKYTVQGAPAPGPGGPPSPSPTIALSASPSNIAIIQGASGSTRITITPQPVPFNTAVSLSCSGLPMGVSCSFLPASLVPGSSPVTSVLTISSAPIAIFRRGQSVSRAGLLYAFALPVVGIPGLLVFGQKRRQELISTVAMVVLTGCLLFLSSCGGGTTNAGKQSSAVTQQAGSFNVTVYGSSGSLQSSTTVTVAIH